MSERDAPPKERGRTDRDARRAAALRANLARRKAQSRARAQEDGETQPDAPAPPQDKD
jgi:hypothetical protein